MFIFDRCPAAITAWELGAFFSRSLLGNLRGAHAIDSRSATPDHAESPLASGVVPRSHSSLASPDFGA